MEKLNRAQNAQFWGLKKRVRYGARTNLHIHDCFLISNMRVGSVSWKEDRVVCKALEVDLPVTTVLMNLKLLLVLT